jgi:hypothetical protein
MTKADYPSLQKKEEFHIIPDHIFGRHSGSHEGLAVTKILKIQHPQYF